MGHGPAALSVVVRASSSDGVRYWTSLIGRPMRAVLENRRRSVTKLHAEAVITFYNTHGLKPRYDHIIFNEHNVSTMWRSGYTCSA